MRAILRSDRTERKVYARIEAEERAKLAAPSRPSPASQILTSPARQLSAPRAVPQDDPAAAAARTVPGPLIPGSQPHVRAVPAQAARDRRNRACGRTRPRSSPSAMTSACHCRRNSTISSWLRPMKFHHITIRSPSGSPPISSARSGSNSPGSIVPSHPGATYASSERCTSGAVHGGCAARRRAVHARNCRRWALRRWCCAGTSSWAPTTGLNVRAVDARPSSSPRNTLTIAP